MVFISFGKPIRSSLIVLTIVKLFSDAHLMKDTKTNELPHKDKEGINLTSIFENRLRDNSSIPQETLSPPKICTDTSLLGNTSNVLCT